MLTLRLIGPDDYSVRENGHPIGRIRFASDRAPALWLWTITVTLPGPPFGDAATLDEAKARFKSAWLAFKDKHSPEELARTFEQMAHANRPDRYRR
ncbi:hypothetical protein [Bradyrhizobium sp. CCBAU 45384]|uniref:hypothetical protein n=1 Tax=Bradyrhizobium sp. CCBAU 45384 TaxID=858428 RepID=UPI0023067998|nr:hypothetical protein [Bradyrhizobium sp. CCBAU 45384]MDA9408739.1 hypothetical protein [Bradyrhizobium sp. CCBAU 45384]